MGTSVVSVTCTTLSLHGGCPLGASYLLAPCSFSYEPGFSLLPDFGSAR